MYANACNRGAQGGHGSPKPGGFAWGPSGLRAALVWGLGFSGLGFRGLGFRV